MKKIICLLLAVLLIAALYVCTSKKYKVDYHGQMDFFRDAKESYKAGTTVRLICDTIATDTDYSFHVVGAEYTVNWSASNSSYVIKFKMPKHDVEVYMETSNSMVNTL